VQRAAIAGGSPTGHRHAARACSLAYDDEDSGGRRRRWLRREETTAHRRGETRTAQHRREACSAGLGGGGFGSIHICSCSVSGPSDLLDRRTIVKKHFLLCVILTTWQSFILPCTGSKTHDKVFFVCRAST
jgi:hypothetical protein